VLSLLLTACGWLAEPPPDHPLALALHERAPSADWTVRGPSTVVAGQRVIADAALACTSCPSTCQPLALGPMRHDGTRWRPLDTPLAHDSAALSVQPMTGGVGLVRTVVVDVAPVALRWPASWAVEVTRDGSPVTVPRSGAWLLLDAPGSYELEGGGTAEPPMVVDQEHVVLTAESLGLTWPPGPTKVRVTAPPGVSTTTPSRSRWDGGEVLIAYHHLDVVSEGRARWVGPAGGDGRAWVHAVPAQVARWPGLPEGPWTGYSWPGSGWGWHDKGLLVPQSGEGDAAAWVRRWLLGDAPPARLDHGWADDGLLLAVEAWARGERGDPEAVGCYGVRSVPPEAGAAAGATLLHDLAERHGEPWLLERLAAASPPTWEGFLVALPEGERERLSATLLREE